MNTFEHQPSQKRQLLLIDNDHDIQFIAREWLPKHAIEVQAATDLEFAMVLLLSQQFDCIVMKSSLTEVEDSHVCQAIRRIDKYAKTPIIISKRSATREDRVEALEAGATDSLSTPFNWPQLAETIRYLSH